MAPLDRFPARRHHAVAVPLGAQGHMTPLMRLCEQLASRHSFLITFVNVDPVHDRLSSLQAKQPPEEQDDSGISHCRGGIRFAHVALPTSDLRPDYITSFEEFAKTHQGIVDGLESLIRGLSPPATCLISDILLTSPTQLVADRVGIPRVAFFTSGHSRHLFQLYVLTGRLSADKVIEMALECRPDTYFEPVHEGQLEGLVPLRKRDLPVYKHVVDDTEYIYHFLSRELKMSYERSHAIVVNSFMELEGDAIRAFSKLLSKPALHAVGPLCEQLTSENSTSLWKEDDKCVAWLDEQPPGSVLYVSFGSITMLSKAQFEEVLSGLEGSSQRFLWACRPGLVKDTITSILEPFLEKVADRGYITEWAPQALILKHPSVGAFLSHCGWNSTLEGIANGVPMLCWPYFGDQFLNARYISDVWKVGLTFQHPSDGGKQFISGQEIERCIKVVMEGEEGKIMRENATKLKEAAWKCQTEGGSAQMSIEALVRSLP